MLLEFKFRNWLSFNDSAHFSMMATRREIHMIDCPLIKRSLGEFCQ